MTMFESPRNFKEMFGSGLIVNDIKKMYQFIYHNNLLKTIISCVPTQMAINEGIELENYINNLGIQNTQMVVNDSLSEFLKQNNKLDSNLPSFLNDKVELEKKVLQNLIDDYKLIIPKFLGESREEVIAQLTIRMESLI